MLLLTGDARDLFVRGKEDFVFIPIIAILTSFSLAPTSTTLPTIVTLAAIHSYCRIIYPSQSPSRIAFLLLGITVGGAVPNIAASREAFSSAPTALVLLIILSSCTSSIVIATTYLEWLLSRAIASPFGRMLLFPAIWSTVWTVIPYMSPVGHLMTWSRPNALEGYRWLIPILGTSSQDWIAASWAVVGSEVYQGWYMGPAEDEDEREDAGTQEKTKSYSRLLTALLLCLIVPSYFIGNVYPRPVNDVEEATPVGVGCIMPTFQRYKHYEPTLDDYIKETMKYQNSAKFLLWPEGAVSFDSDAERDAAFARIRSNITGAYVGVSYEQHVPDPDDPTGRKSLKKTGISVIGQASSTPYLTYYKRHLVPVVESYKFAHSAEPPALVNVSVPRPRDAPPPRWGGRNALRNISVSASICLDFATPLPFSHLDERPGLILAPARTWEQSVGVSMWLQAKQRAEELDTMVLWCDGGEGGVSGVAGGGYESFQQVGPGSWVRNIGFQYPFQSKPTVYARWGDSTLMVYWVALVLPILGQVIQPTDKFMDRIRGIQVPFLGNQNPERRPLLDNSPPLIDFSV